MEYNYFLINPEEDRLREIARDKFFEVIIPATNELDKILTSKEFPILKVNMLLRKIEGAAQIVGISLRAQVNIITTAKERQTYQRYIYKQLEELYEKYANGDNKINWEKVKEEKGVKFLKSFPLQDAIEAAKLIQSGELIIE